MARNNQKVTVQISLDGKKAEDLIQSMTEATKKLKEELKEVKDASDLGYDEQNRRVKELETEIKSLEAVINETKRAYVDVEKVMDDLSGTTLRKLQSALRQVKKEMLGVSEKDGRLETLRKQYEAIEGQIQKIKGSSVDVNKVIKDIPHASFDELNKAAKQLRTEMEKLDTTAGDYARKRADYITIRQRIDEINESFRTQNNLLSSTLKRLSSYVAVYWSFNQITSILKDVFSENIKLSDSLADIRKTTGLTTEEVDELSRRIDRLDTRTAQKELHDLAYEAGKLGISAKEDVMEFVRAGNQVRVALGEDLGEDAIRNLMKLNDVMGNTKTLGIEKSLLATGSAINEVGQSSTANEGYMVDFAQRLGGIAAQSHLTMPELIALGGTTDALGQNVEVSATALNKFVVALQTNTRAVAQAAGINDEYLNSLLSSGNTMQAMLEVLEGLSKRGGLKDLAPLMGDLGSDGARLTAVLSSLTSNVDMLKAQLYTANQGFEQAVSVTQEYNIKNETAAAIMERMGNTIKEYFINSKFTGWIKNVLSYISDIPNALERNIPLLATIKGLVKSIMLLLTVKSLKRLFLFLRIELVSALGAVNTSFIALKSSIVSSTVGVTGLAKAWKVLKVLMQSNWLGAILTVITAIGIAVYEWATHLSEAEKAIKSMNTQLMEENGMLESLKKKIDRANAANGERQSLITELNNKYGKYLGYMLDESATAEQLARAYKLINAEMEKKSLLQAKEEANRNVRSKYAGLKAENVSDIRSLLESDYGAKGEMRADMLQYIQQLINETEMSSDQIVRSLENKYNKALGLGEVEIDDILQKRGRRKYSAIELSEAINEYKRVLKEESEELEAVADTFNGEIASWSKRSLKERQEILNEWSRSLFTPEALKNVEKSKDDIKKYIEVSNQQLSGLQEAGKDKTKQFEIIEKNIRFAQDKLNEISFAPSQPNYWGEGLDITTASIDKLAAKWKELWKIYSTINADKNYKSSFFKSREEEMKALSAELDKYEAKLKSLGANKYGNPLSESETSKENKLLREQKKIIAELVNSLNAYFTDQENIIREAYLNGDITAGQMTARIERNNAAHVLANAELRKAILKQDSDFFAAEYGMNEDQQKRLEGLHLTDKQLISEQQEQLQVSLNKEKEIRIKHLQDIQNILNSNDELGAVRQNYQAQLESLQLFQRNEEALDKESSKRRMDVFTQFSKDSRSMTVDDLREKLSDNQEFFEYTKNMTQEEYSVLLLMLQNYLDASEQAEVRMRERRKRLIKKMWEGGGENAAFESRETTDKGNVQQAVWNEKLGIKSNEDTMDAELLSIQHKMEALQAYYDFSREAGLADLEAKNQLNELQQQADDIYLESQQIKIERLREYTDAVVSFSEEMGEAAFGEVSDRQEAGRKLVSTLIDTTKKLIVQWAKQKVMNAIYKKAMLAEDIATSTMSQALSVQDASQKVSVGVAETEANVQLGIASGTAKETGKLGLIGLAVGAVIAAALGALLSTAKGKASQALSSVGGNISSTSKKKLAEGMLTYASGKYPVLGDDGKVYDARYVPKLKTGLYSGGPHYAIFSEEDPEIVIDGPTTKRMLFNHRELYDDIMYLSRNKTLPAYAEGRYPVEGNTDNTVQATWDTSELTASIVNMITPIINANSIAINNLNEKISKGLYVNMYGKNGLDDSIKRRDRFNKNNRLT